MECDAARFGRERHCKQPARKRVSRDNKRQGGFEVSARFGLIPRGTARRKGLQAKSRALGMTDVASCETLALLEKDRLHPRAEELEVQRRGGARLLGVQ